MNSVFVGGWTKQTCLLPSRVEPDQGWIFGANSSIKVKHAPNCNTGFLFVNVPESNRNSIIMTKEAHLRFTVFSFSGQTHLCLGQISNSIVVSPGSLHMKFIKNFINFVKLCWCLFIQCPSLLTQSREVKSGHSRRMSSHLIRKKKLHLPRFAYLHSAIMWFWW